MAMKKSYYTVNGRIMAEYDGTTQTDYIHDALGSVVGTVNSAGVVVNTYTYKPYGEQLAKTGTGADPKFGWVGSLGYRKTSRRFSEQYIRARHYGTLQGQWTTKDPVRTAMPDYSYCGATPSCLADPSGLYHQRCDNAEKIFPGPWWKNLIIDCKSWLDCEELARGIQTMCNARKNNSEKWLGWQDCVKVRCGKANQLNADFGKCIDSFCSGTLESKVTINCPGYFSQGCCTTKTCMCTDGNKVIHYCNRLSKRNDSKNCGPIECQLAHELMHRCGSIQHSAASGWGSQEANEAAYDYVMDTVVLDCACFGCVEILPGCGADKFYSYRYMDSEGHVWAVSSKDCYELC